MLNGVIDIGSKTHRERYFAFSAATHSIFRSLNYMAIA
jgi:hypothetical protein